MRGANVLRRRAHTPRKNPLVKAWKLFALVPVAPAVLAGTFAFGHHQTYPEGPGALNPAVTQQTIQQTICVKGWTKTVRPPEEYTYEIKRSQLAARGIHRVTGYQLDHVVALELGGAPSDPANLYTVTAAENQAKGRIEDRLRREVCDGKLTLAQGQAADRQAQPG